MQSIHGIEIHWKINKVSKREFPRKINDNRNNKIISHKILDFVICKTILSSLYSSKSLIFSIYLYNL